MWVGQLGWARGSGVPYKHELDAEKRTERQSDWWFTAVSAAGAFAVIAAGVASWLPISDSLLAHVRVPVSLLFAGVGAVLGYVVKHRY